MPTTPDIKDDNIEFIQYHQPGLIDGDYQIAVRQEIKTTNDDARIPVTTFPLERNYFHFSVSGDRFILNPSDIQAVFPPTGSLGEHSRVLPQILLNRSTLPWERKATEQDEENTVPWLTLLLFEENEKPTPQTITLKDLKNTASYSAKFPNLVLETGQQDDDKVTVIDLKKKLLQTLIPDKNDLELMAHVRKSSYSENQTELAAIVGNRLPKQGGISTVHLVSVEGRYPDGNFDYQGATDEDCIRLVSLKSWSFACINKQQSFKELLKNLNREPSTLRLPNNSNAEANKYLAMGYIPLPHNLRQGNHTISWYHGPLIPAENTTAEIPLPVPVADELIRYDPVNGLFDVSYAAAWQLGRLLALQSKNFSVGLYNWKRTHNQQLKASEQFLVHSHLPFQSQLNIEVPDAITSWFRRTSLLQGVPFNYLVPDERMLPQESIRFFCVDPLWIDCLLDGAFSIGRVISSNHEQDQSHTTSPAENTHKKVSGFLLRSDVVAGWPGLLVDAYKTVVPVDPDDKNELTMLRMDRLSPNVLICLFEGEVKRVEIHQKPETLHFGFSLPDDNHTSFYKKLRDKEGQQLNLEIASIPWKENSENPRVINITELANNIKIIRDNNSIFTSAQFALEMIEGVEKVSFRIFN